MKGAILAYIRVSTEGQRDEGTGLEVQRNAILVYATLHGLEITQWYQDVESGAKERREGLDAIRAAVATEGVVTLLVYRLDRIARDVLLAETVHRELTRAGCRIISVSEAIDDSPSGNLMRQLLAGFAQYERAVIALRTSSGRKSRVANTGSFHGGGVPYGYRATGDRHQPGHGVLAVDDASADAVRRVFALRDTGISMAKIAATLNSESHRTAKNALFTAVQVKRILDRRDVYAAVTATTPSIALHEGVRPRHAAIIA